MKRLLLALCLFTTSAVYAQSPGSAASSGEDTPWFRQTPDNNKFALIIVGASASDQIRQRLRGWAKDLHASLRDDYGYSANRIQLLMDDGVNVGDAAPIVRAGSGIEDISAAISRIQAGASAGDQLNIFLFGHGSSTFGEAKFNNVGPDMTGAGFAEMLAPLSGVDMVIFNTTSASFEFSRELSALGRVVVSATRSPAERYDPTFGGFMVSAMQQKRADIDRNGRVSVLEIFNYANGRVTEWYREQQRLSTENAVLDDSGDGLFSREPGLGQADGMLAEIAYINVLSSGTQKTSPEAQSLQAEMQNIERDIFILRNQKSNFLEEDYWNRLEALLIDLATRTRRYNELP
ncbi:MAG: hypothetical protein Q7W55_16760 [Pseudohongiella sp.]|nr:hypothetical protein [Pseudohongiella sp.]MDO9520187.1 hypothetical protein [Pseudohongiella sp.]MDP2125940.1 hypothetical protein [Pseudohongiella sp.]